jgi:hypothetical protein
MIDQDQNRGLYSKFHVSRRNDPEHRHDNCRYFVLDINHDPHARAALQAYADSCREKYPKLADDLMRDVSDGSLFTPVKG